MFFILATIAYAYLVSACFSSSNVAGIISLIGFFLLYQPFQSVGENSLYEELSFSEKAAMCLAAPSCMGIGSVHGSVLHLCRPNGSPETLRGVHQPAPHIVVSAARGLT